MQARAAGLRIALRQTDGQAIAHLEALVGAILEKMNTQDKAQVMDELAKIEQLSPEVLATVQTHGELPDGVKPQRQAWRSELAGIQAQLDAPDDPTPEEE